jgi:transketolase
VTTTMTQDADTVAINTIRTLCMDAIQKFDRQPQAYRDLVLPPSVKARVAVEQASTLGWDRYVGDGGAVIGMHTFGASAPLKQLLARFGFTPDQGRAGRARARSRGAPGIARKGEQ